MWQEAINAGELISFALFVQLGVSLLYYLLWDYHFYICRIMMSLYNTCEQKHDQSGFTQIMPLNCNVIKLVNNMVIDSLFNTWPVHVFSILISAALVTWRWHSASLYNLSLNHTASSSEIFVTLQQPSHICLNVSSLAFTAWLTF